MTSMASTTILFGVLLMLLGLAGYFLTGTTSVTALIAGLSRKSLSAFDETQAS